MEICTADSEEIRSYHRAQQRRQARRRGSRRGEFVSSLSGDVVSCARDDLGTEALGRQARGAVNLIGTSGPARTAGPFRCPAAVGGHADVRKNDDQVDALSIIGQMLDVMVPPKVTNVVRVPQLPRDYVQAHELERDDGGYSWKTA